MTIGLFRADATTTGWEIEPADQPRRLPAWLLSSTLHITLLLIVGFLPRAEPREAPADSDRTVGIALVRRTDSETSYFSQEDTVAEDSDTSDADAAPAPLPSTERLPVELSVALPTADSLSMNPIGELPRADGFALSNAPSRRVSGGQGTTNVFGTQGTGSKFIYVFDRSASMLGFQGRPLAAAKYELTSSLEDLQGVHQFQILFYNNEVAVLNPDSARPPNMLFASDENKRLAKEFVSGIGAAGSTRHMEPLRRALAMQPDVVFFLTDAAEPQLTPGELAEVRRMNRGSVINAIEFGSGPFRGGDNFLVRLARQNDGEHVYVDISRLR